LLGVGNWDHHDRSPVLSSACAFPPAVFLRHGRAEFGLPVSFFVCLVHRKKDFENEIGTSIFVFRFPLTSYNRIAIAISVFSSYVFVSH